MGFAEAPDGDPALGAPVSAEPSTISDNHVDTATSSNEILDSAITPPANDNQPDPVVDERAESTADEPAPTPELQASNDNFPLVELPAAGTK